MNQHLDLFLQLYEMLRIIGYHIPATMVKHQSLIVQSFNLPPASKSSPVTFEPGPGLEPRPPVSQMMV
jgi:hypothetical protein